MASNAARDCFSSSSDDVLLVLITSAPPICPALSGSSDRFTMSFDERSMLSMQETARQLQIANPAGRCCSATKS